VGISEDPRGYDDEARGVVVSNTMGDGDADWKKGKGKKRRKRRPKLNTSHSNMSISQTEERLDFRSRLLKGIPVDGILGGQK